MANYIYQVNQIVGERELQEINQVKVSLDNELIQKAEIHLQVEPGEKMFFNGYQSWTWCPEYTKDDVIRDVTRLPELGLRRFDFDRYGDYHFVTYPQKPGCFHGFSYCYFRDGETYRFFGSLSEEEGYTIFFYDANTKTLTIKKDCEGVRRDKEFEAFSFYYKEGTEEEVFDGWFNALKIKPRTDVKRFGYSSWYNHYEDINEKLIEEDLEGCKKLLQPGDVFQIDDGWEPTVGDWLEPDSTKFPSGMRVISDKIHDAGFVAGLWLAPFVVTEKSVIYKEHQDWLIHFHNRLWKNGSNWGGFYSLNLDLPEVRKYVEDTFHNVFDEWNFDMVKLDFLYAGCPWGDEEKSRGKKMIDAMKWLRELCGDKIILGCGVPLMPSFGLVDYCRIGCDVALSWNDPIYVKYIHREMVSTQHTIDNTIYRRQLNGRAFLNDPDVFFLRDDNLQFTPDQKEYLYTLNALFSGILLTSDNLQSYDPNQIEKLNQVRDLMNSEVIRVKDKNVRYSYQGEKKILSYPTRRRFHFFKVRE